MDIASLYSISSSEIGKAASNASTAVKNTEDNSFSTIFNSALSNISETDSLIHDQEEEEIKFSLGLTENTHDLAIAAAKAQIAVNYTVALRDRFIEAYRELMQMQF